MVYLQNLVMGICGNSPFFWAKKAAGYTLLIDEAEQMTVAEADDIIRSTKGSHKWRKWPVEKVEKAIIRVVDMQLLKD